MAHNTQNYWISGLFLVSWGGVGLSPLGTSATNWPTVPAPNDRWWWMWSSRWNENWQGIPKYSEKTCPSATLSTAKPTWPDLGSNPGRRCGKPATNRLNYGTACFWTLYIVQSKGTNKVSCLSPHVRTETDPISEMSCSLVFRIPDNGQSPKTQ
jgi:hypothetical protein